MAPTALVDIANVVPDAVKPKSLATKEDDSEPKHFHGMEDIDPIAAISHASGTGGPQIATMPDFVSFHDHRTHLLQHMAATFRHWSRSGYVFGISGHISIRDPEYPHAFWTNPLGVHFGLLKASDMILLSLDGEVLRPSTIDLPKSYGTKPANAAGFLIHAAVHKRRPDVHAACHAHTKNGKAWSVFGKPLQMLTQDTCKFFDRHSVYNSYGGVVLAPQEGELIADALGEKNVMCILRNHGLLSVGQTVDEAAWLFDAAEAACGDQLAVEAADPTGTKRVLIDDVEAAYNAKMEGGSEICYAEFQAYYDFEESLDNRFKQ